jgi:hypothetical protein
MAYYKKQQEHLTNVPYERSTASLSTAAPMPPARSLLTSRPRVRVTEEQELERDRVGEAIGKDKSTIPPPNAAVEMSRHAEDEPIETQEEPVIEQYPTQPLLPQQPQPHRLPPVVDAPPPNLAQAHQDVRNLGLVHISRTTKYRHDKRIMTGQEYKRNRTGEPNKCRTCGLPRSKETGHTQLVGHLFCPHNVQGLALDEWKILTKAKIAEAKAQKAAMLAQGGGPQPGPAGPRGPPPPPPPPAALV